MNRELQEITHKKNNDTSIALRPQQLFCDMNALYQLGSYLVLVGWIERNLTNFWVFLAELVNGSHLQLKAFEQGRLWCIAMALPTCRMHYYSTCTMYISLKSSHACRTLLHMINIWGSIAIMTMVLHTKSHVMQYYHHTLLILQAQCWESVQWWTCGSYRY